MAGNMNFFPKIGEQLNLENLPVKDGQFIVTIDDSKIYVDIDSQRRLVGEAKNPKNLLKATLNLNDWERDDQKEYYYQSVNILGISGKYPLIVDLIPTINEPLTAQRELKDWAKMVSIQADEDSITAYCYNIPSTALNIQLQEV